MDEVSLQELYENIGNVLDLATTEEIDNHYEIWQELTTIYVKMKDEGF